MSSVLLNCGECGVWPAATIPARHTDGLVSCSACGAGMDVTHAFMHAPWCSLCGDDINYCECGE